MPIIDSIVTETTKQIIEPVSEQIVNRLLMTIGCRDIFGKNIFLVSDDLKASNFDDENNDKRIPTNRCDVNILPSYNPLQSAFDATRSRDLDIHMSTKRWTYMDYPVLSDPRSHIYMFEVCTPISIELQFSLKVKSIELADMINTALYSRYLSGGSVHDYNDIVYSYGIPDKFLVFLYRMYNMQDDLKQSLTFPEYLKVCTNDAVSSLINHDRLEQGGKEVIIRRANTKVLGKADYSGDKHQTEDINKVSNRYIIDFTYVFQFNKPRVLKLSYPVMIYNKLIDRQWIGTDVNMHYGEGDQYYPDRGVNRFLYSRNNAQIDLNMIYPLVRHPFYDDWNRSHAMYASVNTKYKPLFIGLMCIQEENGELQLSVDIKDEIFPLLPTPVSDAFMSVCNDIEINDNGGPAFDDLLRRQSIFDVSIFCEDSMIQFDKIDLSRDLKMSVKDTQLNLAYRYRVVLSLIIDLRILSRVYVYYMLDHPEFYQDILALHMDYLESAGFIKILYDPFDNHSVTINRIYQDGMTTKAITINNYVIEIRRNR